MKKFLKKVGVSCLGVSLVASGFLTTTFANTINSNGYILKTIGSADQNGITDVELSGYNTKLKTIEIPAIIDDKYRVKTMTNNSTEYSLRNREITAITLPNTLETIGQSSLDRNLITEINLPEGLKTIGYNGLANNLITELHIPDSMEVIGRSAFKGNKISKLKIPDDVAIEESSGNSGAFSDNELTEVEIPESWNRIPGSIFSKNKIKELHLNDTVTVIGQTSFSSNEISSLTLPKNLKEIERSAFSTNKLTTVEIPNGVTSIGDYAFAYNLLEVVKIPPSVVEIGPLTFRDNPTNMKIIGEKGSYAEEYATLNGFQFEEDGAIEEPEPEPNPDPDPPVGEGETEAEREIDANIVTGDLTLNAPSNKAFSDVQLGNNPKTVKTSINGPIQISDLRGTQEGWRLDVSATQFEIVEPQGGFVEGTESHKLPKGSLSLGAVTEVAKIGNGSATSPIVNQTSDRVIDDGSVTVATATKGTGMGDYNLLFDEETFSLVVDATTAKIDMVNYPEGKTPYKAKVSWNLVSAP